MNGLGMRLSASLASLSRAQCLNKRLFDKVQENIPANPAYSYSRWMTRSFSLSNSVSMRCTQEMAMASPRWINHSGGKGARGAKRQSGPPASSGGSTPPASGSSGSESDGSAPPASSSGEGDDGDGKDDPTHPAASSSSSASSSSNESSSSSDASSGPSNSLTPSLPSQPPSHPTLLALPIARRPLFPGFYKAVVIKNPSVVAAIKEMMKRGQPYLGAFLLKDGEGDSDIITDINEVHDVGVFAQITSVFGAASASGENKEGSEEGLTAVLYPHRRIRITELVKAGGVAQVKVDEADPQTVTPPPSPTPSEGESQVSAPLTPLSFLQTYPISIVNTVPLPTLPYNKDNQYIRAFTSEIVSVFKDIAQLNPLFRDQITNFSINQVASNVFDEPDRIADFAAAVSSGSSNELQEVLEATAVDIRLQKALLVLKKELINAQLQNKLSKDVDSKIAKRQREYYLMEQLKGIKKELGLESDGKDKLIEKFKTRAAQLNMPASVRKVFDEELNKLSTLEPSASEANVTRTYLDWLTQLPWGVYTPSVYSIERAQRILDEDHYGLEDLKERILEFIAVGKLRGSLGSTRAAPTEEADTKPVESASSATASSEDSEAKSSSTPSATVPHAPTAPEGKILLLVGPPGVGKTSVGKSLARAVGREFFRFSVGGLGDVAEIKGHRRTYVGALPGKIVQALKRVGTSNPLVLIDEIDKLGRGHNGDPSSALLEMLDPEQNREFLDHYLDVPIDLSRVLFVCTANNLSTIPAPLLDRMEVLEVAGYVSEEKAMIAERYLAPQAKEASGLKDADVVLERDAVDMLIKWYCRESGVRNLKKHVEKIYRKAALKIVKDLGEDVLPEPPLPADAAAEATTSQSTDSTSTSSDEPSTEPASAPADPEHDQKTHPTTTHERAPLRIPPSVHIQINSETLKDYVGPPVYQKDRMYEGPGRPPAGVSTGLGYLGNGSGAVMPIETITTPGKGSLILTGKLGEVIRESAQIALSWVKAHAYDLRITKSPDEQFLVNRDVHIHMPEGSIGKEGPSAGTAILSALVSLGTGVGVRGDMAMTGEISLSGHVLPVGGLKEKILAAHRAGIKTILAPKANQADIEANVPASVKEGIKLVYVEDVREVLEEVFRGEEVEVDVDVESENKESGKVRKEMIGRWGESVRVKRS